MEEKPDIILLVIIPVNIILFNDLQDASFGIIRKARGR
jgi:hypothetical protein